MRKSVWVAIVLFSMAGFAGVSRAVEVPVAVSPGDVSQVAQVEGRCPTFHWGAVAGARSYELVVYRLAAEDEEARVALRRRFAGSVTGWTPTLDQCLNRGARYAWSIRARGGDAAGDWSRPALFEVPAGPSRQELEVALALVHEYLGPAVPAGARPLSERPAADLAAEPTESEEEATADQDEVGTEDREARGFSPPDLIIEDGIEAEFFRGIGSELTQVNAARWGGLLPSSYSPAVHNHDGTHLRRDVSDSFTGPQLDLSGTNLVLPGFSSFSGTGTGSGLDADKLDGHSSSAFALDTEVDTSIDDHVALDHRKIVFVTNTRYSGDLDGLAGAHGKCQERAESQGIPGRFKAWISGSEPSDAASAQLRNFPGAYYLLDGTKVADNWIDLTNGNLDHAIDITEFGGMPSLGATHPFVWTATSTLGALTSNFCIQESKVWTSAGGGDGNVGRWAEKDAAWTQSTSTPCSDEAHLYCFEQ